MLRNKITRGSLLGVGLLVGVALIAPIGMMLRNDAMQPIVETGASRGRTEAVVPRIARGRSNAGATREATRDATGETARAARSDPHAGIAALESLAAQYSSVQEDDAAHEAASRCLALDPANAQCAVIQLRSSMRTGEFDRARDETVRCFELAPANGTCVYADAMIRLHDGDLDGATASLGELRDVEGDSTMVRVVSASIAMRRGDRATAMADLHEACSRGQPWACGMERRMDGERDARGARNRSPGVIASSTTMPAPHTL